MKLPSFFSKPKPKAVPRQAMVSLSLETHLKTLAREIRRGDRSQVTEFRHSLRFAPDEMRGRIGSVHMF